MKGARALIGLEQMSAFDLKRTWASALQMSAYHPKQTPEGKRNGN